MTPIPGQIVTSFVNPELCQPPDEIFRVARADAPLTFSEISASDALLADSGNRFDVPGGAVLYCATSPYGCYTETLCHFRPTARVRALLTDEPGFMVCGSVPADWRHRRLKVGVHLADALPFLDVEHADTHEYLTTAMAPELEGLDIDVLDVGLVRGRNRLISRAISSWAYSATDDTGTFLYSGLRYVSRLSDEECWAVFEGCELIEASRDTISVVDPDLQRTAKKLGLVLH